MNVNLYNVIGRSTVGVRDLLPPLPAAGVFISSDGAVITTLPTERRNAIVATNQWVLSPIATSVVIRDGGPNRIEYIVSQTAAQLEAQADA